MSSRLWLLGPEFPEEVLYNQLMRPVCYSMSFVPRERLGGADQWSQALQKWLKVGEHRVRVVYSSSDAPRLVVSLDSCTSRVSVSPCIPEILITVVHQQHADIPPTDL